MSLESKDTDWRKAHDGTKVGRMSSTEEEIEGKVMDRGRQLGRVKN